MLGRRVAKARAAGNKHGGLRVYRAMKNRRRTTQLLVALALALALAPAQPVGANAGRAGPAQADEPTLVAEPAVDLVDGQLVTVTASGLPSGGVSTNLVQCRPGAVSIADCDERGTQLYVQNGQGERQIFVRAVVEVGGQAVDCRREACVLGIVTHDDEPQATVHASTPLGFDPDGPLAPPPTLTVTPGEGLADGQSITATGQGFVHGDPTGVDLDLRQCVAAPRSQEDDCQRGGWTATELDEPGSFSWEVPALARIYTPAHGTVDCRTPGACVLVASNQFGVADEMGVAPLSFDPAAPLLPPPSVDVTPDDALVDGQVVVVEADGLGAGLGDANATVLQCARPLAEDRCKPAAGPALVEDGSVRAEAQVFARIPTPSGEVDCRTSPDPCVLVVSVVALDSPWDVAVDLAFDSDGPLLPDPEITVTPTTDLHDFAPLTVHGARFSPGAEAVVRVCQTGSLVLCDVAEWPTADADGRFELDITAWADFTAMDGGAAVDCRQAPGCTVTATDTRRAWSAGAPLAFGPPDRPRGRYLDPVFDEDEIVVDRDVVYRETTDADGNPVQLMVDIYRPGRDVDRARRRPAVVWLHGGGFSGGTRSQMEPFAMESARRGYVAVTLDYRVRYGDVVAGALDAYEDATAGVEWLAAHAREWRIDRRAIAAGGFSAGAITATNLAYAPGQIGPPTSRVAAAISLAGAFFDPDDPSVPLPPPLPRPDAGEPPAIAFHPTGDTLIPAFGSLDRMCPLVDVAGIACEYVAYEGAGHLHVATPLQDTIRRSHDFLAEHMLEPLGYCDVETGAGGHMTTGQGSGG